MKDRFGHIERGLDPAAARLWKKKTRAFLDRQYDPRHGALAAVESLLGQGRSRR